MFKKLWNNIANRNIYPGSDKLERIETQRMNFYAFIIGIILIINGIRDLCFGHYIWFIVLSVPGVFCIVIFFFTKVRFNHLLNLLSIELLIFIIFFFSSTTGFDNGIAMYYFVMLLTSIFIFNRKHTIKYNIITFFTVFILFTISHLNDFRIFTIENNDNALFSKNQRFVAFIQTFIGAVIFGYFILSKNFKVYRFYHQTLRSNSIINDLKNKIANTENYVNIEKVVKLAIHNDIGFMPVFKQSYPDFQDNLLQKNKEITQDEIKFCALLKLGFTTKDIAEYTHLTVRSVQTRKNRLRKAFAIPSETDLYIWIDQF